MTYCLLTDNIGICKVTKLKNLKTKIIVLHICIYQCILCITYIKVFYIYIYIS